MKLYIRRIVYRLLLLFFITSNTAFAVNITPNIEFFIDKNSTFTLQDIQTKQQDFKPINSDSLHLGFVDASIWLKYKVKNSSNKPYRNYLVYTDPIVGELDVYFKDISQYYGVLRKHTTPYVSPTFLLELEPWQEQDIYLKIHSRVTPKNIEVHIYDEQMLNKLELTNHFVMSLFFGFLIALIVYNASIYFSIRDKVYLYYILYVFSMLAHHFTYRGFVQLYITNDSLSYITTHPVPIMQAFIITSIVLFSISFLGLKRFKKIYITYHVLAIVSILNALFMLYPPFYNLEVVFLWVLISIITIISSTLYLTTKNVKHIKLYLLGWTPLILIFTIEILRQIFSIGIVNDFAYLEEFVIAFEATVFSVAISLRVKQMNEDKNEAKDKLLHFEKGAKEQLELEIADKTKELKHRLDERDTLLRELNHRVKNNMQIIISMLRLQANKYGKHEKEIVQIAENRIRSMLFIHELLYKSNKNTFDIQEYFKLLIEEISNSFALNDRCLNVEIQELHLDNDQVVNLGFIINELLTNAIKHAKPKNELLIYISLQKTNNQVILSIEDNGIDFKTSKDGLGTLFIDTMVDEQLKAKIHREFDNGYKVQISIPETHKSDMKVI